MQLNKFNSDVKFNKIKIVIPVKFKKMENINK